MCKISRVNCIVFGLLILRISTWSEKHGCWWNWLIFGHDMIVTGNDGDSKVARLQHPKSDPEFRLLCVEFRVLSLGLCGFSPLSLVASHLLKSLLYMHCDCHCLCKYMGRPPVSHTLPHCSCDGAWIHGIPEQGKADYERINKWMIISNYVGFPEIGKY